MGKTAPKYVLIQEHIKQAIEEKTIIEKLPGERTLAAQLNVSYMTVRKAIENLVNEGILYKVPTRGTFVADRNPARKLTHTIGYYLDRSIAYGLSSPYYSLIFEALEKEAAKHNYSLVYFSDYEEANVVRVATKVDGVIVSCFPRIENLIQSIKSVVPVVVIENDCSDKSIPSVIIDNFNAVVDAMDHLHTLGHHRIGFMTGLDDSDVGRNRRAGYQSGLRKHGIQPDPNLIYRGNYSFEAGIHGAEHFLSLKDSPSAIMCANDSMALGAVKRLDQAGLSVPQDISVLGFDDIEVASQVVPALTTLAAPVKEIAQTSFAMLHRLIEGESIDNKHIALPAELVIRQSCADTRDNAAA